MPKTKHVKEDSSSDSDSGPDDKNEPPKKKSKSNTSTAKMLKNDEGALYLELDRYKRVTVRSFKGKTLIDIREYYEDRDNGKIKPGKKGISLSPALWNTLKSSMNEIDDAIKEM